MKKILTALVLLFVILGLASCQQKTQQPENEETSNPQNLQILKTDLKLTQDQVMSQIKAEHIKENKGYKDTDEIIVLINTNHKSLIDYYLTNKTGYATVSEFALSCEGEALQQLISRQQTELINTLKEQKLIKEVVYSYSTVTNGIACKIEYQNLNKIEKLNGVSKAIISETYNQPKAVTDTSAIINDVDVYETGIFNPGSVEYTGNGTVVAVLDSGFDCSHTVFANQPSLEKLTIRGVSDKLHLTTASKFTKDLEITDVYYSKKIPYVYDYADKDPDVFPYDSEHGTHVAGIIGGKDDVISGVAIDTQLVLLKVFPDLDQGGKTEDILAALEDAVLLGVDAINMSLGSSCGFTRAEDTSAINAIYDSVYDAGISLITAASNDYSSAFGGDQGNTNMVTNPDSGTVGAPSTYKAALSVASISGTKSKYLYCNDSQVVFFKESNAITGKENDFFEGLGITEGVEKTFEYVTIPGVGKLINFKNVGDLTGKIALIKRGDNTFEEKALNAKRYGAAGCIIYNNIDGDIIMSMGKSDHIPTISISKDDGEILAAQNTGKITIKYTNQAGPFMSDFSSWGPTPDLKLKPEITAHGGNIKSSVPGGGYDEQSGTSMATPNLCGVVLLIKQYLNEKYPDASAKEITRLTNQLLMSTSNIILNQEGNPYSPRKQGAGLGSLANSVTTKAVLTVDGIDRTKLELYDDPNRTGVYTMKFNIENLSSDTLTYDLSLLPMTESVSTSDEKHVAEKSHMLSDNFTSKVISGGKLNGKVVTVDPNSVCKIELVYTLSNEDKTYIDSLFPYGMYVEGFVKLTNKETDGVDLNIPFLAFYGDWTEAPMFDKTYYEVDPDKHNKAIDEEDKLKADYYATTPYGSYFYNYIIPLGTYLYDIDESVYDAIPASSDHIAISNILGTIDGISTVYAGLLRNAKKMTYTITDKLTGEVVYTHLEENASKAHYGGIVYPYYENLLIKSAKYDLINNREYEFKMQGELDYGDGGYAKNIRNSFAFDFTLDDEAPTLKEVTYEKIYDKTLKKDRYYINMVIYDNHYVQSVSPIIFTSSQSYALLSDKPIPVYSSKGQDNKVRFEITDYLEVIENDSLITSALAFSIDDYALNSNIYICQLPGTKGDFKFTKDGTMEGTDLVILSMYEDEVVDLTKYLATKDKTLDENKDYLKYLKWSSSNEDIAEVKEGLVKCKKAGRATITVSEQMDLNQAVLIINVKEKPKALNKRARLNDVVDTYEDSQIKTLKFSYFETLFAYSRAAQTSEIGDTGDKIFFTNTGNEVSFYPGEQIRLYHDLDPWYAADKYTLKYSSSNPSVASVDETGKVTALKEGTTNILLSVEGTSILARVKIVVKSEFVIENRTLIAYKGLGGEVVIPDDEGILYIGSFAFCLYDTDRTMELPEDDFDANKIPQMNTSVTKVVIPYGVEEVQKYAFYNCTGLKEVVLPETCKIIRENAFHKDEKLTTINLDKITVIGARAFKDCVKLENLHQTSTPKIYAIGLGAFEGCKSLKAIDLTTLRNTGAYAFNGCTSLTDVTIGEHTKLAEYMFYNTNIKEVELYEKVSVPKLCFSHCNNLTKVVFHNNLVSIEERAFSECPSLNEIIFNGEIERIGRGAFATCTNLTEFTFPNCEVEFDNYVFHNCENLTKLIFDEHSSIKNINGAMFNGCNITTFDVHANNDKYALDGKFLTNSAKDEIIIASATNYDNYVLDEKYKKIGDSAFTNASVTSIFFTTPVEIGQYAFAESKTLTKVEFANVAGSKINQYAFLSCHELKEIVNLDTVTYIGDYAFTDTYITKATLADNLETGMGIFFQSKIEEVTIGANSKFGPGVFRDCVNLKTVNMPEAGNVSFGEYAFANDRSLVTIDLSKAVGEIKTQTFYGCSKLQSADLAHITVIGEYAFADCSSLSYLNIPVIEEIHMGAFSNNATYAKAPIFQNVTFPNTLRKIGEGAFLKCEGLKEVNLDIYTEEQINNLKEGEVLLEIGDYAFSLCLNLTSVKLPDFIDYIGKYQFASCESLNTIDLTNIKTIGEGAFRACLSLTSVAMPNVETIGDNAFLDSSLYGTIALNKAHTIGSYAFKNTNITSLIALNVETLKDGAFNDMKSVTSIQLGNKVTSIGNIVFLGDAKLKTISFDGKTDGTINDYLFLDHGVIYKVLKTGKYELVALPGDLNIDTLEVLEGTTRVSIYAGNENPHLKTVVFPDSLLSIGNYAFYHCKNLKVVEFKSVKAPALECEYNGSAKLETTDPGYELLHQHLNLFGYELYYYQFVDLVGKVKPLIIILPINEEITGYDALVYRAYFGEVKDADRSDYVAMEQSLNDFIEYATEIKKLKIVTLMDEKLIANAQASYGAITQDPMNYNISQTEWNDLVDTVNNAKKQLLALKLANSSEFVQTIQSDINKLPDQFNINEIAKYRDLAQRLAKLTFAEKNCLDLTKYNNLVDSYIAYCDKVSEDTNSVNYSVIAFVFGTITATTTFALVAIFTRKY